MINNYIKNSHKMAQEYLKTTAKMFNNTCRKQWQQFLKVLEDNHLKISSYWYG